MRSGYLFDTSVVSSLAPDRKPIDPQVTLWLHERSTSLFLPTIVVAELEQGVCRLRRRGGLQRAARLTAWLETLMASFAPQILDFDSRVALLAGRLSDEASARGRHPGFADIALAATALARDMVVLTLNTRHFEPLGVELADPFEALP